MNKSIAITIALLIVSILILTACGPTEESASATAAAETLNAISIQETAVADVLTKLTQTYEAQEPTQIPSTPTAIPPLSQADLPTEDTQSDAVIPAIATNTPPLPSGGPAEKAAFVTETIPDGTNMTPGQTFTKTWKLKNDGTSTWSTQYALVFVDGEKLSEKTEIYFPVNVPPGQLVDISVEMKAPAQVGKYKSYWKLRSASGTLFGIGTSGSESIWAEVEVTTAPTGTVVPTNTPDPNITFEVKSISIDATSTSPTNITCGDKFILTVSGSITSSTSGKVTYKWKFDGVDNTAQEIEFTTAETIPVNVSKEYTTSASSMSILITLESITPNVVTTQSQYILNCN
jgi:hypothetical protein